MCRDFSETSLLLKYMFMYILGPGLAIRVICADEPYMCRDFAETSVLLKFIADYSNALKTVS